MYFAVSLAGWFTLAWLGWGVVFAIVEGYALFLRRKYAYDNYSGGTLSELAWRFAHTGAYKGVKLGALTIFMVWLDYHFLIEPLIK